jgi:branched-chain amino acid transport system permease protein
MTLIGGIGTILGPVVGAFFLTTMENYLAQAGSWVTIIEGVIFVICVLTFREGIVGVLLPYAMGRRARSAPPPEEIEIDEEAPPALKQVAGGVEERAPGG